MKALAAKALAALVQAMKDLAGPPPAMLNLPPLGKMM